MANCSLALSWSRDSLGSLFCGHLMDSMDPFSSATPLRAKVLGSLEV